MIITINPYTQAKIKAYSTLTSKGVEDKIQLAQNTFIRWRDASFAERAKSFRKMSRLLRENAESYAEVITAEMGKPISQAIAEVEKCAWVCDYYCENAAQFLRSEFVETEAKKSWIVYEPLGVILGIMPWNFPFWQVMRFVAPTLMAGNVVLIKHAPGTIGCAVLLEELFEQAGFEQGIYTNLIVTVEEVPKILEHQHVKAVTLTGSEPAGAAVASSAAAQIKKSVLELGGSNALIVCKDADLRRAVDIAITGRMQNNGQSCIAVKRILVQRDKAEVFINLMVSRLKELVVDDPFSSKTDIGPLARLDLAEQLEEQVMDSIRAGASPQLEFKRNIAIIHPNLLTNVQPGMRAFDEELFGPIASVTIFDEFEQAIELSNESRFGLGVSICTQNEKKVIDVLSQFEQGSVFINQMVMSDPRLPFGGIKKSGFGRELGIRGIHEFVNTKTVYVAE